MRSFLGFSVYFIHFVENYAKHAAPLHDMTHDTFDWDKSTWVRDYESDFNNFKERLSTSMDVIFPDFALEWIVLPDASDLAVGWIILQLRPMADTSLRAEPISIGSEKLSPVARRWPINEKEGYALVRSVRSNSNLLATKPFLIASDHWNLSYIETNPSAKVQRYLLALQEFPVKGCLMIDGKDNTAADFLSRMQSNATELELPLNAAYSRAECNYYTAASNGLFGKSVREKALLDLHSTSLLIQPVESTQYSSLCAMQTLPDPSNTSNIVYPTYVRAPLIQYSPEAKDKIFTNCHGGSAGCWGVAKTYAKINRIYPGNGMSFKDIRRRVDECPECQKYRRITPGMVHEPILRVIHTDNPFTTVSIDGIPMTPTDNSGNTTINIVKNMGTHMVSYIASKQGSAAAAADALLLTRLRQGHFNTIISDPGSDFTSNIVKSFNNYIDAEHRLTLVERPQASGIERDVAEAKRFIISLAACKRFEMRWSEPVILAVAEFLVNSDYEQPSHIAPYEMLFGRKDTDLFRIFSKSLSDLSPTAAKESYVKHLVADISEIRKTYLEHLRTRVSTETAPNASNPQNQYQPGDLVFKTITKRQKTQTLQALRLGPYSVVKQSANDLTIKSLITDAMQTIDVTRAILFVGSIEVATDLASRDDAQVIISSIGGWRGNPSARSTCMFQLTFEDTTTVWKVFSADIERTTILEQFCSSRPMLKPLLLSAALAKKQVSTTNKTKPLVTSVGTKAFLDLRWLSHTLYQFKELDLPDKYNTSYYLPILVTKATQKVIHILCQLLDTTLAIDQSDYTMYVCSTETLLRPYIVINKALMETHPSIRTLDLPDNWNQILENPQNYRHLFDPY